MADDFNVFANRFSGPRPGSTVGHYTLVQKLGAGSMGTVYKAVDLKLRRIVALKFLGDPRPHLDEAALLSIRRRFRREARIRARMAVLHEFPEIVSDRFLELQLLFAGLAPFGCLPKQGECGVKVNCLPAATNAADGRSRPSWRRCLGSGGAGRIHRPSDDLVLFVTTSAAEDLLAVERELHAVSVRGPFASTAAEHRNGGVRVPFGLAPHS